MSILDDIMAEDMRFGCDPDTGVPGCEAATYWVRGATAGVSVNIGIDRHGPRPIPGMPGDFSAPSIMVDLAAGQSTAVDASLMTGAATGGDSIYTARKFGGAAEKIPVAEIVTQDAGGWRLKLQ